MRVCAVSFKECWQDGSGNWFSYGGFPAQMAAISSLFDGMTLLVTRVEPRSGGIRLPQDAKVIALARPFGQDTRRKLSVVARLPYYLPIIVRHCLSCDVVHVPLPGDIPLLAMIVALVLNKRLIARYGGSWVATSQTTTMNRVTQAIMRGFAGGKRVMIATGAESGSPASNMHWLFVTAISQNELSSVQPDLKRPANSPLRLVYMGRLSPEKGVRYLLECLSLLHRETESKNRFLLTVIGDGPQMAEMVTLVKDLECDDLITFTGQLNRKEMQAHLLRSDLCVMPSLTEGFCKAALDAMVCGVPVLMTEVGAARETVGPEGARGWLAPPGSAQALADVLRRVLAEPSEWSDLRRRCRKFVEQLTLEAWAQQIGKLCASQWTISFKEGKLRQ